MVQLEGGGREATIERRRRKNPALQPSTLPQTKLQRSQTLQLVTFPASYFSPSSSASATKKARNEVRNTARCARRNKPPAAALTTALPALPARPKGLPVEKRRAIVSTSTVFEPNQDGSAQWQAEQEMADPAQRILSDLICSKFDSVITSIDGETFTGDEQDLGARSVQTQGYWRIADRYSHTCRPAVWYPGWMGF